LEPSTDSTIVESSINGSDPDPVWKNSLREALEILVLGAVFLTWTIGYSYLYGYGVGARTNLILGIPSWAFWGIAFPWGMATLVTIAFAIYRIADDRLADNPSSNDKRAGIDE